MGFKVFKNKKYGYHELMIKIKEEDLPAIHQFDSSVNPGDWLSIDEREGFDSISNENLLKFYDEVIL